MSPSTLVHSYRLPGDLHGDLHGDLADRIFIATAREHGLTLLTYDRLILVYANQGHVNARKP